MIDIAIFARTFSHQTLDEILDAVTRHRISCIHFNMQCVGLASLPDRIEPTILHTIREGFCRRNLRMTGLSATFNAIHPDRLQRDSDTTAAIRLIEAAPQMGATFVSLCTGSRDPNHMWQAHRDNDAPEAWSDLRATLDRLLPAAEQAGVTLGIEPELANVINSPTKARRLLDEVRSPALKIIMDGANLFDPNHLDHMRDRLDAAFELLGPDITQIHAKDIPADTDPKNQAAGTGRLDWEHYFNRITSLNYTGPIVMHNLSESQVESSRNFVQNHLDRINRISAK